MPILRNQGALNGEAGIPPRTATLRLKPTPLAQFTLFQSMPLGSISLKPSLRPDRPTGDQASGRGGRVWEGGGGNCHLLPICGTALDARYFVANASTRRNGAVICPAYQRDHKPLGLTKSAMRGVDHGIALENATRKTASLSSGFFPTESSFASCTLPPTCRSVCRLVLSRKVQIMHSRRHLPRGRYRLERAAPRSSGPSCWQVSMPVEFSPEAGSSAISVQLSESC